MKKILLIVAVALTAFFSSCTKNDPSASLVDQLCSMFNQPVEQALETAKSLGYTVISQGKVDEYKCYKDATDLDNYIDLNFNDENENRVVNVAYVQSGAKSEVVSHAKTLTEQTGESRTVNNVATTYSMGEVDEDNCTSYSQFLEKVGNTNEYVQAAWIGPAPSYAPIIALMVTAQEQAAFVTYTISIGG